MAFGLLDACIVMTTMKSPYNLLCRQVKIKNITYFLFRSLVDPPCWFLNSKWRFYCSINVFTLDELHKYRGDIKMQCTVHVNAGRGRTNEKMSI